MHLLAAAAGSVDEGQEPVHLGQSPADIVFISAADTELAALATARSEMTQPPELRLASMMHLQHPMSVDLHIDACASKAKLVVARVLGGASYWKYGFEQYAARLADAGVAFAALPGDDKPDPDLRLFSTVSDQDYRCALGLSGGRRAKKCGQLSELLPICDRPSPGATSGRTAAACRGLLARAMAFRISVPLRPIGHRTRPSFP